MIKLILIIHVLQPMNSTANGDYVILQESFMGPLGSYIVYSPVIVPEFHMALNGGDPSMVMLLPSGIVISEDYKKRSLWNAPSCSNGNRGSVLTMTYQTLKCGPVAFNKESEESASSLVISTIQNIKDALISGYESE